MGIRSIFAAAVLAVGVGQAEAATVEQRDGWFTLDTLSTSCMAGCDGYTEEQRNTFAGLRVGRSAVAQFEITTSDDLSSVSITVRYGQTAANTLFSNTLTLRDDGVYRYRIQDDAPWVMSDYELSWDGLRGSWYSHPDSPSFEQRTNVSFQIAAVPVPASAALLPAGFAALAMIRRRRRG